MSALRGVKRTARAVLRSVPARVWERVFPKDVLALGYHMVSDEDVPHLKLYPYKNARQFESDVAFARGRTIDYPDLVDCRLRGTQLPPNRILFTFDDGFAECFHVARPILRKHNVSAVFFVPTDFIDDRRPFHESKLSLCMAAIEGSPPGRVRALLDEVAHDPLLRRGAVTTRARDLLAGARFAGAPSPDQRELLLALLSQFHDHELELDRFCELLEVDIAAYTRRRPIFMSTAELKTLAAEGFTVGSHASNHHSLETLSPERLEDELVTSCSIVRDITGQARVPFAFPYGGRRVDRALLADIRARHPFIELIFDSGPLTRGMPFVVDRVWADDPAGDPHVSNLPFALSGAWSTPSAWFRAGRTAAQH
jgi:peptidoglycan/xylan/chitin deacetylase (PgdA/CDA1 family)